VAGRYGLPEQQAEHIAVAVEFFHTASLLFDDLPAMDDANERRGTPCTHRLFGEATAILAALALVNRAYALLWKAMEKAPLQAHRSAASRLVEQCLGVEGILDGQSRDLRGGAEPPTLRDTLRVSVGKTVSLIRLTLLLPALLGGAPADERFLLRRLAVYWGLAYQILDDLKDLFLPSSEIGKTASRDALLSRPNAALAGGLARTGRLVARLTERSARVVGAFTARSPGWAFLADVQSRLQRELPEPLALPGHIFA
jgi:geranylgeranyl pyrophosphate synthase